TTLGATFFSRRRRQGKLRESRPVLGPEPFRSFRSFRSFHPACPADHRMSHYWKSPSTSDTNIKHARVADTQGLPRGRAVGRAVGVSQTHRRKRGPRMATLRCTVLSIALTLFALALVGCQPAKPMVAHVPPPSFDGPKIVAPAPAAPLAAAPQA